jgi:2-methylcitrate dehydratase PrpD
MTAVEQRVAAPTISAQLADFVRDLRYEDIPEPVIAHTKELLAHQLGLALSGQRDESARRAVQLAQQLSGPGGACTIVGDRGRADLLDAVFANAFLLGHDGRDDVIMPSGVHPGIIVEPVAWAVGETTAATGRELLVAIVAGYEVMTRLCGSVWTWGAHVPRRPNNVVAPFGAAATAARLMSLSRAQTVSALGHAGQLSTGNAEGTEQLTTCHPLLARNGVTAAILASLGVPAAAEIIEGPNGVYRSYFFQDAPPDLAAGLDSPQREFAIKHAGLKRRIGSELNMVAMELAQHVIESRGLRPAAIERVDIALPVERRAREEVWEAELAAGACGTDMRVGALRFRIANILADADIDTMRFRQAPDAEILGLLERIQLKYEDGHPIRYARLVVTMRNGHTYSAEGDTHVIEPLNWAEWLSESGRGVLSERRLKRVAQLIVDLEDSTVPELMEAVVPDE